MSASPLKDAAEELEQTMAKTAAALIMISGEDVARRSATGKWTKKEILGHLIDSAANNHQKFVRAMTNAGTFLGYDQEAWVSAQRYNLLDWNELIGFWRMYNRHLVTLIKNAEAEDLVKEIGINGSSYTLEFLVTDYLAHLKQHLKQIVPEVEI